MAEIKWAKVVNLVTKECSVGLGTDSEYYSKIGYTEQEVEEAWDGSWYLKGYAPEKPQTIVNEEIIYKDQTFLNETDWYAVRYAETGKEIPVNVINERARCREEISRLRKLILSGGE